MSVLVDSNIILDIVTEDAGWFIWSSEKLAFLAQTDVLVINPVIYAEVSIGFNRIEEVEEVLSPLYFRKDNIPFEAAFLAGKCFTRYRKEGGTETLNASRFLYRGPRCHRRNVAADKRSEAVQGLFSHPEAHHARRRGMNTLSQHKR